MTFSSVCIRISKPKRREKKRKKKYRKYSVAGKYSSFVILTHCFFDGNDHRIMFNPKVKATVFYIPFSDKDISLWADAHHALPFAINIYHLNVACII